jgi:hypothetical protein
VVPLSFATRESILTYYVSTFLSPPIFKYHGVEGLDPIQAAKLELLIDVQGHRSKVGLNLYSIWQDATSYGIGVGVPWWTRHLGRGTPLDPMGAPRVLWEGNSLGHVSPYDALPDPNTDVNNPQRGEFFGFIEHTNYVALRAQEANQPERFFNAKYLKFLNRKSIFEPESRDFKNRVAAGDNDLRPVDVIHMPITLIPVEWGLGAGDIPEKWIFSVGGDGVVLRAEPLGLFYDEYPVTICAPLFDNYSMAPVSLLERVQGIQIYADWLMNAHMINIRKALGIHLIYDPLAINGDDLDSEEMVKLIRLNQTHWGRGDVQKYVQQLQINDVTQNNVNEVLMLMGLGERLTGVNESMQGIMKKSGERTSATEAKNSFRSSTSRVQKSAKIISMQCHQDIRRMFAYNIQQLMSKDQILRVTGNWQERLLDEYGQGSEEAGQQSMQVTPEDFSGLDINFDIVDYDSASPGEEDREGWVNLVQPLLPNPMALQSLGINGRRVFLHIARQLGARDAADFVLRPPRVRVAPDEEVVRQAERGNAIPIEPPQTDRFSLS